MGVRTFFICLGPMNSTSSISTATSRSTPQAKRTARGTSAGRRKRPRPITTTAAPSNRAV